MTRYEQQSCWVLHRRPWRESSLIIEVFSHEHGRLGVVAKGARGGRSPWRGLSEPFGPLLASWTRRGELGTLTGLESAGRRMTLIGRALWCGLYANELLLALIGRDEAVPEIFDAYGRLLGDLAGGLDQAHALRRFELKLLEGLGVVPDLAQEAVTADPIVPEGLYHLLPETGLIATASPGREVFSGRAALALLEDAAPPAEVAREARALMRLLLDFRLDGRKLKTRELFRQTRSQGSPPNNNGDAK